MSSFRTIVVDMEKFFKGTGSRLEAWGKAFVSLFRKAPAAIQAVENFTSMVAPVITAAVSLADPVIEPVVAAALATAETGLAAIQAAASAANSGTSVLGNLQSFAASVPQLLSGLDVKDAALKGAIVRIVDLVTGEAKVLIPAVESWVAELAPKAQKAAA